MSNQCCSNQCQQVWNIIIQLSMWFIIIWCGVIGSIRGRVHWLEITSLIIIYIIYEIYFFSYKSCSYFRHQFMKTNLHDYMKELFYKPITVTFHAECYHYETRISRSGSRTYSRRVKVVTFRDIEQFHYYTWRDVSGIFRLETIEANKKQKPYIKLDLSLLMEFADDNTHYDYDRQKKAHFNRNKLRDTHIHQWETKELKGMNTYNLVRIANHDARFIGLNWYILFTIIPVVLLYDWYFNYNCISQKFDIKKVVSTRYDLYSAENNQKYIDSIPRIIMNDEEIQYNEAPNPMHGSPILPSAEEIMDAQLYVRKKSTLNFADPMLQENFGAPGIELERIDIPHNTNLDNENNILNNQNFRQEMYVESKDNVNRDIPNYEEVNNEIKKDVEQKNE